MYQRVSLILYVLKGYQSVKAFTYFSNQNFDFYKLCLPDKILFECFGYTTVAHFVPACIIDFAM